MVFRAGVQRPAMNEHDLSGRPCHVDRHTMTRPLHHLIRYHHVLLKPSPSEPRPSDIPAIHNRNNQRPIALFQREERVDERRCRAGLAPRAEVEKVEDALADGRCFSRSGSGCAAGFGGSGSARSDHRRW